MRKGIIITIAIIACIFSIGATRYEPHQEEIDFAGQGFVKMSATAYCVGHHTADGSAVFEGGCASSLDHIGDVAIVYTLDNEFLGYLICNDTGKEGGGVRAGKVLDVYKPDMDACQAYMEKIGKSQKVWVKWIEGNG
jgi:hypothetical protein